MIGQKRHRDPELDSRDQLLAAAARLMIESGSIDVSLSEIAQRSGLNSALVKYYFGNKSGLMMALLRQAMAPAMEQLAHLTTMPVSPKDKLRIHISGMVNSYSRYPFVNRLMHQLLADDAETYGPLIASEFSKPVADAQRLMLDEGVEAGCFRPINATLFYFHVVGACDQLFHAQYQLRYIFGITDVTDALKREYVDHLWGMVLNGIDIGP